MDFDVVVVGGRCAGSPLAALLAREGARVAVVEKATFPADTLSTHIFQAAGINFLRRLGVLDQVVAAGSEPMTQLDFRRGDFFAKEPYALRPGDVGFNLSVRRSILDAMLADAAAEAGAEVMMATTVTGLLHEGGRASGVRVRTGGTERAITARLVVGADGRSSTVGTLAGSRKYHVVPSERFAYWGFFEGATPPSPATAVYHLWDGRCVIAGPSDSGLYEVVLVPDRRFLPEFRADRERAFMEHARACAPVATALEGATRVGKLQGTLQWESYFRESVGEGWVLVGDAGHFKDPTPGQGMTDAFRQSAALAPAILRGLAGSDADLDTAMTEWARWRDHDAFEQHWLCCDTGEAGPGPAVLPEMFRRAQRGGYMGEFYDLFQHRARPSRVATPIRAVAGTAALAARRGADRPRLLRELRGLVSNEAQRQRLRRNPVYVEPAKSPGARESAVETAGASA
ncbi:MAG: FAD-dependent monooxygenase [Blastococcus sp.]|nr:FAD-dependent monooxygenase [Blastococcus sp.]